MTTKHRPSGVRRRLQRASGVAVVALWSGSAAASATFPAAVDEHLELSGSSTIERAVAPPDGCLLCHMTEAGGFGTNNTFGSQLREHGAVGAEPSTVGPALDALEADDPHAVADIVMGINPNDDHSTPTEALPQPSYGCGVASRPVSMEGWIAALFALALGSRVLRTRKRPQRSQ